MTTLVFREKILKSDNNRVITIPNLTYKCLVLSQIDFHSEGNQWSFEVSIKASGQEVVRLSQSYFRHKSNLDLEKYMGKIEEGGKMELQIKPKGTKKDLILTLNYHYQPSLGTIVYQDSIRIMDLKLDTTNILRDLSNQQPTLMKLKCDDQMLEVALKPKFQTEDEGEFPAFEKTEVLSYSTEIDFTSLDDDLMRLLRYYYLDIKTDNENSMDSEVYILCYGFKA